MGGLLAGDEPTRISTGDRNPLAVPSRYGAAYLAIDEDLAERLGLPVDAGRIGAYGPNVTVLRDFIRSSRQPL